ncbi:hypothetical protein D3C76_1617530 [compost metagenome]
MGLVHQNGNIIAVDHLDDFPEIGRDAEVGRIDDQNRLGVRMFLQGAADGAG